MEAPAERQHHHDDCRCARRVRHPEGRDHSIEDVSIAGEIERKLAQLQDLRAMLKHLAASCQGDTPQNCPIIDGLSGRGRERAMAPRRAAGLNPAR